MEPTGKPQVFKVSRNGEITSVETNQVKTVKDLAEMKHVHLLLNGLDRFPVNFSSLEVEALHLEECTLDLSCKDRPKHFDQLTLVACELSGKFNSNRKIPCLKALRLVPMGKKLTDDNSASAFREYFGDVIVTECVGEDGFAWVPVNTHIFIADDIVFGPGYAATSFLSAHRKCVAIPLIIDSREALDDAKQLMRTHENLDQILIIGALYQRPGKDTAHITKFTTEFVNYITSKLTSEKLRDLEEPIEYTAKVVERMYANAKQRHYRM